jgi:hypothetical protein
VGRGEKGKKEGGFTSEHKRCDESDNSIVEIDRSIENLASDRRTRDFGNAMVPDEQSGGRWSGSRVKEIENV